ncbi:MAG: exodeoxyribonuclease VII large subunit [Clostridiales bacterium]|nr:exodeoxyribonuclease VII large subunit [Clostridiales bacterium]
MENAISVTQVNSYIKSIFDAEYMLQNIFVYGEIGAYKVTNGIAYFNLKDENSLISCVLFGANNYPNFEVGDQVVVRGSVGYYSKGGKLNFNAVSIERFGVGLLYQKFLELKAELEALGYFDTARKKSIPDRVRRIGVVTSETGAVIRDIIDVTTRRNNSIDIVLYPVKVQGLGAEKEIASGIDFFSKYDNIDVIIVGRGGGSLEDLQPYNTRVVADAVFRCEKPLVSAVGHETDYTIIDFISDLRAPTPSAAAELVANKKSDDVEMLQSYMYTMYNQLDRCIRRNTGYIEQVAVGVSNRINNAINTKVSQIYRLHQDMDRKVSNIINNAEMWLQKTKALVDGYDIEGMAKRGYTRVYNGDKVVKNASDISIGDNITFALQDGVVGAVVDRKETK